MQYGRRKTDQYVSDKECEDLETHVILAAERAATINDRLDSLEERIDIINKEHNKKLLT